ncbi:GNAT family N-acetyltransferase [Ruegeria sediminis]|uniref:GNAT family N-acetyltransferase n=1 Tax=Ruegeria sediminis TaxID=2583820 RepID=A0ABY2WX26_9RHOB|nr:GNAT family N-acetyltransferase [Ruegeria sediminis]TMV07012.1 GNAT family N-acetyltransferase [Ruegeria sediminis]
MAQLPLTLRRVAPDDWPELCRGFEDLTYEQTLTYAKAAAERIGSNAEFVSLHNALGAPVAAACLRVKRAPLLNRGIAWIAAGPLTRLENDDMLDADTLCGVLRDLRQYAHFSGHTLRLRFPASVSVPDEVIARAGFVPTARAPVYRTVLIDPKQNDEKLLAALHGKWRNPLRNALKAELDLETGPIRFLSQRFQILYEQVQAAKGFRPDIPPEFYYSLSGEDFDHTVLVARKDGEDIGAMTLGIAGSNATYLFGATSPTGRRLNAGHYLMWRAVLHCRELGLKCLDLGGIDPDVNPDVTRFKLRTGGRDSTAAGPYEAWPKGPVAGLIGLAESLHRKYKT